MGRHSGRRRAPTRVPVGVVLAPLLTLVVGAILVLPVSAGLGVGGAPRAYAAPVDPTPSRPTSTPSGRPPPTATSSPTATATTTVDPTGTSSATADPSTSGSATSTATTSSGGSGSEPSFQSLPSQTAPPPGGTAPTGRVTKPTAATTPGGIGGGGNGNASNAGGNSRSNGRSNGNGVGEPTQVAVAGRKVASPAGDDRSTLDVVPAARTTAVPVQPTTGSPDDTSSLTTNAPDSSASADTSSAGPDLADPPADGAMPGSWRIAALTGLFVLGLAVALLIASARPRGGAHRRH